MAARADDIPHTEGEPFESPPRSSTGQFLPGRNYGGGRVKGIRRKFSDNFLIDMTKVWEERGLQALDDVAVNDPATFLRVAAAILPKEAKLEVSDTKTFVLRVLGVEEDSDEVRSLIEGSATEIPASPPESPSEPLPEYNPADGYSKRT